MPRPALALLLAVLCPCLTAIDVVVVQSYDAGYPWCRSIDQGLAGVLGPAGLSSETIYLDTKRQPGAEAKRAAGEAALARIAALAPKVVIACDDNAQSLVGMAVRDGGKAQVVFCGVNADPAVYGYPGPSVTGILERPHAAQSYALLRQIAPAVRSVGVLSDATETSEAVFASMRAETLPVTATYRTARTFAEWQAAVEAIQAEHDAIAIYTYQSLLSEDGKVVDPKAVMAWTVPRIAKPSVAFLDWPVQDGLLCGVAELGAEHGHMAADIAVRMITQGVTAAAVPVTTAAKGQVLLNLKAAGALGLAIPFDLIDTADAVVK